MLQRQAYSSTLKAESIRMTSGDIPRAIVSLRSPPLHWWNVCTGQVACPRVPLNLLDKHEDYFNTVQSHYGCTVEQTAALLKIEQKNEQTKIWLVNRASRKKAATKNVPQGCRHGVLKRTSTMSAVKAIKARYLSILMMPPRATACWRHYKAHRFVQKWEGTECGQSNFAFSHYVKHAFQGNGGRKSLREATPILNTSTKITEHSKG